MVHPSHALLIFCTIVFGCVNYIFLLINTRSILRYPVGYIRAFWIGLVSYLLMLWGISTTNGHSLHSINDLLHNHISILVTDLLLIGWIVAIETSIMVVLEIIFPTRSIFRFLAIFAAIPTQFRIIRRTIIILKIVISTGLWPYFRNHERSGVIDHKLIAYYLRHVLQASGIISVKLGQFLSMRTDVVPAQYAQELAQLQTRVTPENWEIVENTLKRNWGETRFNSLSWIDPIPLASASVAQVHLAELRNGGRIAIKVRRSTVSTILKIDGIIIIRFSRWLVRKTIWGRKMDLVQFSQGFIRNLRDELDLSLELQNLRAIRQVIHKEQPRYIIIPGEISNLCTTEILVMEAIIGKPLSESAELLRAISRHRREAMARELVDVILHLIFVSGVFHADLHTGNILLTQQNYLALLDFGMVGRLDRPTRDELMLFILSIARQDSYVATRVLLRLMGGNNQEVDLKQLQMHISSLIMRYSDNSSMTNGRSILTDLTDLLMHIDFTIPPDLSYAFRSIATLEGTLAIIAPELDLVTLIQTRAQIITQKNFNLKHLRDELIFHTAAALPIIQKLPERIDRISSQLEQGKLAIQMQVLGNAQDRKFLGRQVQHIGLILVGISALITGVLLISAKNGPMFDHTIPVYNILGYSSLLIGFILNGRSVAMTFQSDIKGRIAEQKYLGKNRNKP